MPHQETQVSGQQYPDPASQPWTGGVPGQVGPGQVAPGQGYGPPPGYPQGFAPMQPAQPSWFSRTPLPVLLTLASAIAGIITFFMGFVGWITISETIEDKAESWVNDLGDSIDIPAYLTPSLVLSPGWFFLLLGVVAVASGALIVPAWRKYLPLLAFLSVVGWLGLFVCAVGLPSFISLGAGAYVALILGFAQMALLGAATVLTGLRGADGPQQGR